MATPTTRLRYVEGRRPVNAFIVAERGDGQWPAGYMGSEHIESPNVFLKTMTTRTVVIRFVVSTLMERRIASVLMPSLMAGGKMGLPILAIDSYPCSIKSPKMDSDWSIGAPHQTRGFRDSTRGELPQGFPFPDGQRRRVVLETGYILGANSRFIDRTMQVENSLAIHHSPVLLLSLEAS